MSLTALLLVLTAAVAHAAWNIIAHGASRSGIPFLWWASLGSAVLWAGLIPVTGGIGSAGVRELLLGIAMSSVLHVAYMLVLQRGYARGELSTVYATARGSGPLLTVLVAVLVLGERPGPVALLGIGVLLVGVVGFGLLGREARGRGSAHRDSTQRGTAGWLGRVEPSIGYGVLTVTAIAAYTLWDTFVVTEWGVSPVAFMVGCALGEVPFFTLALVRGGVGEGLRRLLPELRANWRALLAFGVLSPLSYVLVLTAVTIAPVSLVAPVREVSVILVGLYGVWRFRESRPVLRILAAIVVVAGVVLIGL